MHHSRVNLERPRASEPDDIRQIVHGIRLAQTQAAAAEHLPLQRGTHAKGVSVRGVFEVFDLQLALADSALASRLARGIYACPGRYPAVIRFANASTSVRSDAKRDVRALSFSVDLPAGLLGAEVTRLDYSLNSAPIFPINDAHAFATLTRVLNAGGVLATLRAVWRLPFIDLFRFLVTGVRGAIQTSQPVRAYQSQRFWSAVPFRNGPDDVVKYTAIPRPDNPAQPLGDGPTCLRDELARHVTHDASMSTFDFGLQLLAPDAMTRWGRRREPSYWVENAAVEWPQSQSPFHIVGRLTLVPQSVLNDAEASATYIDVTTNATPDSEPLGSINRARSVAEAASRRARIAGDTTIQPAVPMRPSRTSRVAHWAVAALVLLVAGRAGLGFWFERGAARYLPEGEHIDQVRYLDQGWGSEIESPDRQAYYHTAQGASMHAVRYSWFVNLERPFRTDRFAEPAHLSQLRFILDPAPTRANPDRLPVGFTKRFDDTLQDAVVDITCAACHTGQLNVERNGQTTAIRVDGGQGMNAFTDVARGSFQAELVAAFGETLANPFKFRRFAMNVLGRSAPWSARAKLWREVSGVVGELLRVSRGSSATHLYPTQEGFGRTDALARIGNVVFGDHLDPANFKTGNGPVNFPYLWDIWKFDWVQYNASVSQPMARNVGEALGTGATFQLLDNYGRPIPPADRFRTTIQFENLQRIETLLQKLRPPAWPEDLLGPIDRGKVEEGRALFTEHCVGCHGPHVADPVWTKAISPLRAPDDPLWEIKWKALADVGTDPNAAQNFVNNRVDLSRAGIDRSEVRRLLGRELERKKERDEAMLRSYTAQRDALVTSHASAQALEVAEAWVTEANASYGASRHAVDTLDQIDLRSLSVGEGLTLLGMMVRDRYYRDHNFSEAAQGCFAGFDTLDMPQVVPGYKPRPLEGVWATPPFLHNGSVPNLYDLLSPLAERQTQRAFNVGTRRFDPKHVGYVTSRDEAKDVPAAPEKVNGFLFDTTLSGNSNAGHRFEKGYVPFDEKKPAEQQYQNGVIGPELTPAERYAIIEYLKVGPDVPLEKARTPPDCFALLAR